MIAVRVAVLLSFLAGGALATGCSRSGEPQPAQQSAAPAPADRVAQTNCPVMTDMPISRRVYLDYGGKRTYFCCSDCIGKFNKDPQAYLRGPEL